MKIRTLRKRIPPSIRELRFYTEDVRKNEKRMRKLVDKDYPTYIESVPTGPLGHRQLRLVDTTPEWVSARRAQMDAQAAHAEWRRDSMRLSKSDSATVAAALDADPAAPTESFARAVQKRNELRD